MKKQKRRNCFGNILLNVEPELIRDEFGHVDENGNIVPNWLEESELVDSEGFDKTNIEENGDYKQVVILPKGTKLCRYGVATGKTTALLGTPYEMLGLPYKKETLEYHEYEVIADGVSVVCKVTKGKVAAMFGSSGGAMQFVHPRRIVEEIETGRLKEVTVWLKSK